MPVLVDKTLIRLASGRTPTIGNIDESCIQPASVDLPVGCFVYEVACEPPLMANGGLCVADFIDRYTRNQFDLTNGGVVTVSPGCTYIAELSPTLNFKAGTWAYFNPKSTTGRNFIQTRVVSEVPNQYDMTPFDGYKGRIWVTISPVIFSASLKKDETLVQMRVYDQGRTLMTKSALEHAQANHQIVVNPDQYHPVFSQNGLLLHLDLLGTNSNAVAINSSQPIQWWQRKHYRPRDYFRNKELLSRSHALVIEPGEAALICCKERLSIPTDVCSELRPVEWSLGPLQIHLAGFFDPSFGYNPDEPSKSGASIVLEVINLGRAPIMVQDDQPIGYMVFEELLDQPQAGYGQAGVGTANNYQGQIGVTFAKQFTPWDL